MEEEEEEEEEEDEEEEKKAEAKKNLNRLFAHCLRPRPADKTRGSNPRLALQLQLVMPRLHLQRAGARVGATRLRYLPIKKNKDFLALMIVRACPCRANRLEYCFQ